MIELDGKEYSVKTAAENATDMLNTINDYCATNDIRNSKDELIEIAANPSNPLYLIVYGLGFLVSIIQNIIYSIGCSFSIPNASEKQLLNLCDLAGIKRGGATRTTIHMLVYASLTEDCEVTTQDTVTVDNVTYAPAYDTHVVAGGVGHIIMVASDYGSHTVSEDTITAFDTTIAGLRTLKQYASIPGRAEEPISSLRARLQRRTASGTQIDKATDAILALEGVTTCSIYFNQSAIQDITIDDITVARRSALILVQGYNDNIAEAFFSNCLCATTNAGASRTVTQTYTTHANQTLTAYIVTPKQTPVYITVYSNQVLTDVIKQAMKDAIMTLAESLTPGEPVTSSMILNALSAYTTYGILGVTCGASSQLQTYQISPQVDELFVFTSANIVIDTTGAS